jgi:hypothetical protein
MAISPCLFGTWLLAHTPHTYRDDCVLRHLHRLYYCILCTIVTILTNVTNVMRINASCDADVNSSQMCSEDEIDPCAFDASTLFPRRQIPLGLRILAD